MSHWTIIIDKEEASRFFFFIRTKKINLGKNNIEQSAFNFFSFEIDGEYLACVRKTQLRILQQSL